MTKIQLIDCVSKLYVNKKLQNIKDKETFFKSLLQDSKSSDNFEHFKDIQPIIVKIKDCKTLSTQDLLKKYRVKQINKIK
ncbi:hypothetical protein IJD34_09685 [bacterium]|nr:hypothetical protein [bacterium]